MPTVLIVDDDKHTRALLERMLHHDERIVRHDLRVISAGDGLEGLRLFESEQPDVIITDLLMPRMDGFRFCKELRARPDGRSVGILVLSGVYRDQTISARLREEVGANLFTKPYQLKDLVTALDRQLTRNQEREAKAEPPRAEISDSPLPVAEARHGRFSETPLPTVLLDLHDIRATGTLDLKRGKIEKRIDLVVGHPVAVVSNQRAEMLGQFLLMKGIISESVHQKALERAHDEEKKLGEALIEMGVVTAADLVKYLTSQARFKITRSLRWPDGEWSYRPNRDLLDTASKGNALDPVAVVLLGLRKTASVEQAAETLAPLAGHRLELTVRGARVRHTIARVFGDPFMEALDSRPTVEKLASPPHVASETMPALEALILTSCLADAGGPPGADRPAAAATVLKSAEPPAVEELSGAFRLPLPPSPPTPPVPLRAPVGYDQIFAEEGSDAGTPPTAQDLELVEVVELAAGDAVPEEIPIGDSSIVEMELGAYGSGPVVTIISDIGPAYEDETRDALRDQLLAEYLRVQGKDPYDVLGVPHDADRADVDGAFGERMSAFSLELYSMYDIGPDHAKLEEVHGAYRRAHEILGNADRRAAWDREHQGGRARTADGQMMGAELAFRAGERRLAADNHASAVEHFRLAVDSSPEVADYQAALGWALYRAGGDGARRASTHLAQALNVDPDHAAAHEYLGRILAAEGHDDEAAAEHLEHAINAQPPRLGALEPLDELRSRRDELPHLELLYRALLRRAGTEDGELAIRVWRALGRIYAAQGERDAARVAFETAHRLSPQDPWILDALADLATTFEERRGHLRARWRLDPSRPEPGRALLIDAENEAAHDAAFLASAALVARGETEGDRMYRRYRPRFLVRAAETLGDLEVDGAIWTAVRHPDDDPALGNLFAVLAPAGQRHAPVRLHVADEDFIADRELPEPFARVRAYVSRMLGVPEVRVARRADFGGEAHLGALAEPVLLVGPDVLASVDRVELGFRLGRAMSFLWPGRAFAGSRPARVLKELFIAAVRLAGVTLNVDTSAGAAAALAAVQALPGAAATEAARLAAEIASTRTSVNLSSWSKALARSADRVGLVLCGDPVVAFQAVRVLGGDEAATDVLDYALSAQHLAVRDRLGVSVDV